MAHLAVGLDIYTFLCLPGLFRSDLGFPWLEHAGPRKAGVLGPVLVNYIREHQIEIGIPRAQAYAITMYILAGFLVLGFILNLLVRPVAEKDYMTEKELASESQLAHDRSVVVAGDQPGKESSPVPARNLATIMLEWVAVSIPLAYGFWVTVLQAVKLFK